MEPAKAEVNGDVTMDTNAQTLCLQAWSYIKTKGKQSKTKRVLQSLKQKNTSIMMTHMPSWHSLCSQNIIFPIKTHTGDPRAANQAAWLGGKTLLGFPGAWLAMTAQPNRQRQRNPLGLHRDSDCSQVSESESFWDKCEFIHSGNGGCDGSFSTPWESHLWAWTKSYFSHTMAKGLYRHLTQALTNRRLSLTLQFIKL